MKTDPDNTRLWRSLEELEQSEKFREALEREFPPGASEWSSAASRRRFLQLMGASIALAGVTGCTKQPTETIMPYVTPPEQAVPGKPLYFATALLTHGLALGVLVESHEGRPTKVEGNPDHPASLGATDVAAQASVLSLYDPDRSKSLRGPDGPATWGGFELALRDMIGRNPGGLRILTEAVTSPTLAAQLRSILQMYPGSRWYQYEPTGPHAARAAAQMAFGRPVNCYYKFDAARVVLSIDADFLTCGPVSTRYAHDWAQGRKVQGGRTSMNRLYVAESTMTSTGGKADHRWALTPAQIEAFASELGQRLGVAGVMQAGSSGVPSQHLDALAKDLEANRGACAVIAGDEVSPRVHAIVHAMNAALSNVGTAVVYTEPLEAEPVDQIAAIRELTGEMNAGKVETLLILGGNPVWNAPGDLGFKDALAKVRNRIRLGLYDDETSLLCSWHVPDTHSLEAWSDARAFDGTVTILQPLIAPLYEGRSAHEVLSSVAGQTQRGYDIVRQYWSAQNPAGDFEAWWSKTVHDGFAANTALPPLTLAAKGEIPGAPKVNAGGFAVTFRPDPYLLDGRLANNAWVQELPRPMTKLTWDNAVLLSPKTAQRLGVHTEDVVEIKSQGRSVRGPVWVLPGQPDECATVHLGFGRECGGDVAKAAGFNAYVLRTTGSMSAATDAEIRKTGGKYRLATTQMQQSMASREPVIAENLAEFTRNPDSIKKRANEPPKELTLYGDWNYTGYAWGMAIDLSACVNCNACVIACQAENNIPVVGKQQVEMGRHMHWLRVDAYYQGSPEKPTAYYQPVPCMQCETAPCELVCPTQATNHSSDGLNDMVYNRCVGTRYCSNNCPYKVRRFNFFRYADWYTPSLMLQRNPDVTVRSRGVMEKCTYCVQRIRRADIQSREENRSIRDGEVVTACQQACPTGAIVFGNINDRQSVVARMKADKLNYGLLAELNTRPRTTYLAEIRNPNPETGGERS